MVLAAILVMTLFGILVVGYPLVVPGRSGSPPPADSEDAHLRSLLARKELLIGALRDLELDYRTGKLSEEDYRDIRSRYERQAAAVLAEVDARVGEGGEVLCGHCGRRVLAGSRFCSYCGSGLVPVEA